MSIHKIYDTRGRFIKKGWKMKGLPAGYYYLVEKTFIGSAQIISVHTVLKSEGRIKFIRTKVVRNDLLGIRVENMPWWVYAST